MKKVVLKGMIVLGLGITFGGLSLPLFGQTNQAKTRALAVVRDCFTTFAMTGLQNRDCRVALKAFRTSRNDKHPVDRDCHALKCPLPCLLALHVVPRGGRQPDITDISFYRFFICQTDNFVYDLYGIKPRG